MHKDNSFFLYDMHCHLQDPRIRDQADLIIARAGQAGVMGFVVCGTSEADWPHVAELARKYDCIIPAFGLHPWYTGTRSEQWRQHLESYLAEFGAAAVGEAGLDHAPEFRHDQDQVPVLQQQLELAAALARPVVIHCHRAWNRMPALLHALNPRPPAIVLHAFSGSPETVMELNDLPVYFSFSGSITYQGNRRAEQTVPLIPQKRLLIETDAPDMLPEPIRETHAKDTPNLPEYLPHVFNRLAELRTETAEELSQALADNSLKVVNNYRNIHGSL